MTRLSAVTAVWVFLFSVSSAYAQPPSETPAPAAATAATASYVGSQVCKGCHSAIFETWMLTPHRQTLFNEKEGPAWQGCESCHGPGGAHVAAGGGPGSIINLSFLPAEKSSQICLKCHKNEKEIILWKTSRHARNRLACNNCHNPHKPGRATMLKLIDAAKESVQGLNTAIADTQLAASSASDDMVRNEYLAKLGALQRQKASTEKQIIEYESRIRRSAEPYLCLSCHKDVETQIKLPSHHPILEEKVLCSDCHNPHGGRLKMLRGERQPETCYRCHAEVQGPFVFQHPPVNEDCSLCHRAHGSQYNNLLLQQQPFVCLKCHAGPHSRTNTFGDEKRTADFYWRCTNCHFPHGSDRQSSFHL